MHIKALTLSFFIVGLALANPVPTENDDKNYYEISNDVLPSEQDIEFLPLEEQEQPNNENTEQNSVTEPHKDDTELHEKHKGHWAAFKQEIHKIYDDIKHKYHQLSPIAQHYDYIWETVKHKVSHLIDESEKLYHEIYTGGKTAYEHFQLYYTELSNTVSQLEKDGGETYEKIDKILKSFKKDLDEGKIKSKIISGIKKVVLKGLSGDWDYFRQEWDKIIAEVNELHDIAIKDYHKIKDTAEFVVNGVTQDLRDIKKQTLELYRKIKTESKAIVVEGQEQLQKFEKYYQQLIQNIQELKPHVGELFKGIEDKLIVLRQKVKEFIEIRKKKNNNEEVYSVTHI